MLHTSEDASRSVGDALGFLTKKNEVLRRKVIIEPEQDFNDTLLKVLNTSHLKKMEDLKFISSVRDFNLTKFYF